MKVELAPVRNFGRHEYLPMCERSRQIGEWLEKKHLSKRDRAYLEKIGLEVVLLVYNASDKEKE